MALPITVFAGDRFGSWTVVFPDVARTLGNSRMSLVRCDCGNETVTRNAALRNGKSTKCKSCRYKAHSKLMKVEGSEWNTFLYRYQSNAARRDIEFCLTMDEFMSLCRQDCYYCGANPRKRVLSPSKVVIANGIDRADSSKDYTVENCLPCCDVCNKMKMKLDKDFFVKHAIKIARKHGLRR